MAQMQRGQDFCPSVGERHAPLCLSSEADLSSCRLCSVPAPAAQLTTDEFRDSVLHSPWVTRHKALEAVTCPWEQPRSPSDPAQTSAFIKNAISA